MPDLSIPGSISFMWMMSPPISRADWFRPLGERYVLGGQNIMLRDMLGEIARLVGRSPPKWRIPRALVFPLASAAEGWAYVSGREPFATVAGLRMAKYPMFYSSAKAERELGLSAAPM